MAVVVIRDPISGKRFSGYQGRRLYIYAESSGRNLSFSARYAPKEIDYGGWEQEWVTIERPGGKPLLVRKQQPLFTISFTLMMGEQDIQASQVQQLQALQDMARTRERVLVAYSPTEAGLWRITSLTFTSQERNEENNEITRALASLTLTEASDAAPAVGPCTGGAGNGDEGGGGGGGGSRTHTVVSGDTLWGIALQYYGDGTQWPRIYDANRGEIEDPHWIFPGEVFTIP